MSTYFRDGTLVRKSELTRTMDSIEKELKGWDDLAYARTVGLTEQTRQIGQRISVDPDTVFPETVKEAANSVLKLTRSFIGTKKGEWKLPEVPTSPDASNGFLSTVIKCARDCFRALPATERLQKRNEEVTKIDGAIGRLRQAAEETNNVNDELRDFEKEYGTSKDIRESVTKLAEKKSGLEEKLKALNQLTEALNSLLTYMTERGQGLGEENCPACGNRTKNQQAYLRQTVEALLSTEGKVIQNKLNSTGKLEKEANETLQELIRKENQLKVAIETSAIAKKEVAKNLVITWKENEDPLQVLNKRLETTKSEADQVKGELEKATENLRCIENECDHLKDLAMIWSNHELSKRLSSINGGLAYKELKSLSAEAGQLKLDCQAIIDAIISTRDEESRDIVKASKSKVREYFTLLAENPGIDAIDMRMETERNSENYNFYNSAGEKVIPILSLGDLNSLALAIFAGLGEANRDALAFQTIVFDDPSQSMGSHHKKKLVVLLNTLAQNRQVIVSTMDKEFFEALNSDITMRKKCIIFEGWDPENGPRISD